MDNDGNPIRYFGSTQFWLDLQQVVWPGDEEPTPENKDARKRLVRLLVAAGGS